MQIKILLIKPIIIVVSALVLALPASAKEIIVAADNKHRYHVELLTHVLNYSDIKYNIDVNRQKLPKNRAFQELASGKLHVVAGSLKQERANRFNFVPVPLVKGLLGWRINLVNADNQDVLKDVQSIVELKRLAAGSRDVWSDTEILEANNLRVLKSDTTDALYKMLEKNRYDYFPRSALRVEEDFQKNKQLNIAIDRHILIKYPHAYVYYVDNHMPQLAKDIELGLKKAMKDGSLDQIFSKYYGEQVNKLARQSRAFIELKNPYFPMPELLEQESYWLKPSALIDDANIATKPKTK